jgi:putative SOS response-associated peptidase YedK
LGERSAICHNFRMCGRYRLSKRKQLVEEHFESVSRDEDWSPRSNIAPTQPVLVTQQNPKEPVRRLSLVRWGLVPSWSKDMSGAASMINARSETAATKPAFRDALKSRRCLVPADGFYEWQRTSKAKQPFCLKVNVGSLFAFAGLWDRWKDLRRPRPHACHSRPEQLRSVAGPWGMTHVDAACDLLRPYDAPLMCCYPVSARVNGVVNDDEECSVLAEVIQAQSSLFS